MRRIIAVLIILVLCPLSAVLAEPPADAAGSGAALPSLLESVIPLPPADEPSPAAEACGLETLLGYDAGSVTGEQLEQILTACKAALNAQGFETVSGGTEAFPAAREKELCRVLLGGKLQAVIMLNEETHRLWMYAQADGEAAAAEPAAAETAARKDTAYRSGTVWLTGNDGRSVYDLKFTDGTLTEAYLEDDEGKGGWGGDSAYGIEHFRLHGMTVEEASAWLEEQGYRVSISDKAPY